jgi:hypothetical protein
MSNWVVAGAKYRLRRIGQQHSRHVLAEFLGARIRIVVGSVPLDGTILGDDFVATLSRHRYCAHFAESSQAVIVLRLPRQREDFERAAQIHVQATFF